MAKCSHGIIRALGFGFWLTVATFAATSMTAWHSVALPLHPGPPAVLHPRRADWQLTHYLSVDCACSRAVARHLIARGPFSQANEAIVFVGSSDPGGQSALRTDLIRSGFETSILPPERVLAEDGVDAVPLLRITGPDGTQLYRGGYRRPGGADDEYLDLVILSDLMASRPVSPLRILGCATSQGLRSQLDPLSLRSLSFPETR